MLVLPYAGNRRCCPVVARTQTGAMPQPQPPPRPNAPFSRQPGLPRSYPPVTTGRPPGGRAAARGPAATATGPVADPKNAPDLTVNKVVAGAGAAATSAVL